MWSKLSTGGIKGALGNVKDAWSSLEQSLDAAVGQEPGTQGRGPITIPPAPSSTTSLAPSTPLTTSLSTSASTAFGLTSHVRRSSKDLFDTIVSVATSASRSNTPSIITTQQTSEPSSPRAKDQGDGWGDSPAIGNTPTPSSPFPPSTSNNPSVLVPSNNSIQPDEGGRRPSPFSPIEAATSPQTDDQVAVEQGEGQGGNGDEDAAEERSKSISPLPPPPPPVEMPALEANEAPPAPPEAPSPQPVLLVPDNQQEEPVEEEEEEEGGGDEASSPPVSNRQATPVHVEKKRPVSEPSLPLSSPPALMTSGMIPAGMEPAMAPSADPAKRLATTIDVASIKQQIMDQVKDQYESEILRLQSLLHERENHCVLLEGELRKAQNIYNEDDAKQRQINALLEEGKALAYKQSEMEKAVRRARGELKGVETERNKLQQDKEALEQKLKSTMEQLKKKEVENGSLTQSLAAVQAVNQASSDKLVKVEMELNRARDEIQSQKTALEKAWAEEKELRRIVTEVTAEHGDLLTRMDQDKLMAKGIEEVKQEYEQREALLQATNKQLQEAITRTNFEAGLREDAIRQELADMRKRWQDAVSRTESLAADMHESTAPLLRQIKALQEEARVRATAWAMAEETLTERARTAEASARTAEATRKTLMDRADTLEGRVAELEAQLTSTTSRLEEALALNKTMESREVEALAKASQAHQEVIELRETIKRLQKESRAVESKLKLQLSDAKDALQVLQSEFEDEKSRLEVQMEGVHKELADERKRSGTLTSSLAATTSGALTSPGYPTPRSPPQMLTQSSILERTIASTESRGSAASSTFTFGGGNGEVSVLAMEKLQQTARQKEEEVIHLQRRVVDVERTRDALTQEVAELGKRYSQLQFNAQAMRQLQKEMAEQTRKNEVLLELLGEKTEELEALQQEMVDLKSLFRKQLDEVLGQNSTATTN